jgi:hypothetical protein
VFSSGAKSKSFACSGVSQFPTLTPLERLLSTPEAASAFPQSSNPASAALRNRRRRAASFTLVEEGAAPESSDIVR